MRDAPTTDGGVDYRWVMETTFVLTVVVGAPAIALFSTLVPLEGWRSVLSFAIRVGAAVWLATTVGVFLYARSHVET